MVPTGQYASGAKNNMQWCDIGVNLLSNQFSHDRQTVLQRAEAADVTHLVLIGSDIEESHANIRFCQQRQSCITTAGVHPHQAAQVKPDWQQQLRNLLQNPYVVAVGECGLDFNRNFSPPLQQENVFSAQLALARETDKPVYLHERDAFDRQLAILTEHDIHHGVVHCFTGDISQLKAYLDAGFYIGITGWLCDERRGQALQQALAYIPDDRLLLETDAPYLLPRNMPAPPVKKRNEPAFLPYIAAEVARLKNISLEELATFTLNNSRNLFRFSSVTLSGIT